VQPGSPLSKLIPGYGIFSVSSPGMMLDSGNGDNQCIDGTKINPPEMLCFHKHLHSAMEISQFLHLIRKPSPLFSPRGVSTVNNLNRVFSFF
jgi:hypothetical protein